MPEIISNAQLSADRHCNRRVRLSKARGAPSCLSATAAYVQSTKLTTADCWLVYRELTVTSRKQLKNIQKKTLSFFLPIFVS